jgi:TolB protein
MNTKRVFINALLVVAAFVLFGGGFLLSRDWLGLAPPTLAAPGGVVGEWGPVGLVFSQPMAQQTVQKAFRIDPAVNGRFQWGGSTLWFFPDQPLAAGTAYRIFLAAGIQATNGRKSTRDQSWTIKVRPAEIIYLSPAGETADLWVKAASGGAARQLTQGKTVYDYAVSADGEQIAFSALNPEKGYDLWVVSRDGSQARKVAECGSARCTAAAWGRGGTALAYSRTETKTSVENTPQTAYSQNKPPEANVTRTGQPQIWTLDLNSGLDAPLYADAQFSGTGPLWSPDGQNLAFIDLGNGGIRIFNFDGRTDIFLPANTPVIGSWSADSSRLFYSDLDTAELPSFGSAFEVSLPSGQVTPLFGDGPADADYNAPLLSPDGNWLVVGLRFMDGPPGRQLWIMSQDGSQQKVVSKDVLVTHAAYSWSPDGTKLAFQQLALGSSSAVPEVMVWDSTNGSFTRIASDATHPQWLP